MQQSIEGKTDKEIVAEFCGMRLTVEENHGHKDYEWVPRFPHSNWCFQNPPPFDTSYDWLIPAWVKFRELIVHRVDYFDYLNHKVEIRVAITERPISEAFAALVEGIKWYNSLAVEKQK